MEIARGGECIVATMVGFWMSVTAMVAGLKVASGGEGFAKTTGMPQKWTAEGVASGAEDFEFASGAEDFVAAAEAGL